jgi:hypothetical protein
MSDRTYKMTFVAPTIVIDANTNGVLRRYWYQVPTGLHSQVLVHKFA